MHLLIKFERSEEYNFEASRLVVMKSGSGETKVNDVYGLPTLLPVKFTPLVLLAPMHIRVKLEKCNHVSTITILELSTLTKRNSHRKRTETMTHELIY